MMKQHQLQQQHDVLDFTNLRRMVQSYQYNLIHCCSYLAIASYCYSLCYIEDNAAEDETLPHQLMIYQSIVMIMVMMLVQEFRLLYVRSTLPYGDLGYPIVGHLPIFIKHGPRDIYLQRSAKYGNRSIHNMLGDITLSVSTDDDVNFWLKEERKGAVRSSAMPHVYELLGKEAVLLVETAAQHRRLRRIFQPSFSPQAVKSYLQTCDQVAQQQLLIWESSGNFQPSREWSLFAMRLFLQCAFEEVDEDFMERLNVLFEKWLTGFFAIMPYPIPGNRMYTAMQAKKELSDLLLNKVSEFRAENPMGTPLATKSLMGRLCYGIDDDGQTLSDSQLVTNLIFIMFAGHDTTKGSFCGFVHYLNKYPSIEKLLVEEVQLFSEPLDMDELKSAPILNAFMAETWRLAAPLGAHIMQTTRDIPFRNFVVRKGVKVALSIQGYNVNPDGRYSHPEEFRIERWLDKSHPLHDPQYYQNGVNYNAMSTKYRPFAMGAHGCLGAHFAKMEARVVLTRMLRSYKVQVRNESLKKFPLLQHENEFQLQLRQHNHAPTAIP